MVDLKIDLSEGANGFVGEREGVGGPRDEQAVLGTIDFSNWYFCPERSTELMAVLETVIRKSTAEAFRNVLQSDPPHVVFEGDDVSVTINVGSYWNDGRVWFVASIGEMIDEYIEHTDCAQMTGGHEAKLELAKCLRSCALKLETAAEMEA